MPPRFAYWTIILEGKPTAFRAQLRDDLIPTFKQLQTKHPDVVMKWFARGRLWESPEEAHAAERRGGRERRGPGWRPGGEHQDPRARFDIPRDEKRRRFAAQLRRDRQDTRSPSPDPQISERRDRQEPARPRDNRAPNRPEWKPRENRDGERRPKSEWKREGDWRPSDRRPPREDRRPSGRDSRKPGDQRTGWTPRPPGENRPGWKPRPPAEPASRWKPRPPGEGARDNRPSGNRPPAARPEGFRPKGPGDRRGGFRPDQRNRVGRKPGGGGRGGGRGGGGRS